MRILGVDFTSAPSRRKAITVARGELRRTTLTMRRVDSLTDFASFESVLRERGPFVGGFDFPFGLPRDFLESGADLPRTWADSMHWLEKAGREELRERFRAYCTARPPGSKFAHRATDLRAGSSPSMKWVNPPVAFMLKEGAPRLLAAGLHLPGLHDGDLERVALEAYPALLARRVLGHASYKSDTRSAQTSEREARRARLLEALEDGLPDLPILRLEAEWRRAAIADGSGDVLDAILCALQAASGATREGYGLPTSVDPLEGWIVGVPLAEAYPPRR